MAESDRRARCAARPGAEALDGRILLSHSAHRTPPAGLQYGLDRRYATPQSGEVDFTVTRSPDQASGALAFKVRTTATVNEILTPGAGGRTPQGARNIGPVIAVAQETNGKLVVRSVRTTGPNPSALPFAPIDGTYRFAPGQTSLTIPLHLNPAYAPSGEINLHVVATLPRSNAMTGIGDPGLTIMPSEDQVPPEVASSSVSPRGITLTFSKAMDPATVEDLGNYQVQGWTLVNGNHTESLVTLASAAYDPATRAVTLTPTAPLAPASYYVYFPNNVFMPMYLGEPSQPAGVRPLADLQGNTLVGSMILIPS